MGYITVDNLGNITKYSDFDFEDSISLNDEALCALIKNDIVGYKFINSQIEYHQRPTRYHRWTGIDWVHDSTLVTTAKEEMWEKIKLYRDTHKYKGVKITVNSVDYWIHSDEVSRIQHLGLLGVAILHVFKTFFGVTQFESFPEDLYWKTLGSNNLGEPVFVLMTWVVALQIFAADMKLEAACFGKAEYHRMMLLASSDPYNYDYTTGWPAVFGD